MSPYYSEIEQELFDAYIDNEREMALEEIRKAKLEKINKQKKAIYSQTLLGWALLLIPIIWQGTGFPYEIAMILFATSLYLSVKLILENKYKSKNYGAALLIAWLTTTIIGISPPGIFLYNLYYLVRH